MAKRRSVLLLGIAMLLNACGSIGSFRMLSPQLFGMDKVASGLYIEPVMTQEQRDELSKQIAIGRTSVERFWGEITTSPYFVACVTNICAARFGSQGDRATAFGDRAIRLSPNGLIAPLVAHEWSHVELYHRMGGVLHMEKIPRWFDEGIAVVIANEPRHSQENWLEIQRRGLSTPALSELSSRSDWISAVKKYGETNVDDPNNLRVVYSVAGRELRRWLACSGASGIPSLLAAVRDGELFAEAYSRLGCTGTDR
ncbi:MAG TPA: hypothetical protein VJ001_11435 [Rhodocyclaceae bacterium]|nr:hypothetical protein [Rhodocyclaceae bacterium]